MTWYADLPAVRTRQLAGDALAGLWSISWLLVGRGLYRLVERLRAFGDRTRAAGGDLASRMERVAGVIDDVPLVGGQLRQPFSGAADAARSLEAAGAAGSDAIHTLALWLGILVALLPVLWITARYLPGRVRWAREAGAARALAQRLDEGEVIDLLALRASVRGSLVEVGPLAGDRRALAVLELRRLGLSVTP